MAKRASDEVRAGGGVICREGADELEIVVVHRPRYDDWSLPKGKLEKGESFKQGALREVEEETGFVCELGEELTQARYHDRKGRSKIVRYWLMTVRAGEFEPNEEVDELRWLTREAARAKLDYDHDRMLIDEIPDAD